MQINKRLTFYFESQSFLFKMFSPFTTAVIDSFALSLPARRRQIRATLRRSMCYFDCLCKCMLRLALNATAHVCGRKRGFTRRTFVSSQNRFCSVALLGLYCSACQIKDLSVRYAFASLTTAVIDSFALSLPARRRQIRATLRRSMCYFDCLCKCMLRLALNATAHVCGRKRGFTRRTFVSSQNRFCSVALLGLYLTKC